MIRNTLLLAAQADGFTGLTPDKWQALVLELLKLASGTSMTRNALLLAAQADGFTGLTPDRWEALVLELLNIISGGSGGGGGPVQSSGLNFCVSGVAPNQIFKLRNLDTGLANRLDASGADGVQQIDIQDGSAC